MKKLLLAILALNMLSPIPVFGEESAPQSALGVSPAISELVLTPGEKKTDKILVFNVTNFPLPIKGTVRNFNPKEEVPGEAKKIYDASSWFTITPSDFILQPNSQKEVKITVNPPKEAEPGGHYATIYFQPLLPAEVISPQTAYLTARVGVLSFLIVKGDIEEKASLTSFNTKSFRQFGPIDLSLKINNEGNVHLLPVGEAIVWDFRGKKLAEISLAPSQILPKTIKEFSFSWPKKYLLGKFFTQAKIRYGSEQMTLKSEKISFWVIPWIPLAIIITLLTSIISFMIVFKRRIRLAFRVLLGRIDD